MNMKKILLAVAVVVVSTIVAMFFSIKIAAAIALGSMLIGMFLIAALINIKVWLDIEKKDPELAKKLLMETLINSDFYKVLY